MTDEVEQRLAALKVALMLLVPRADQQVLERLERMLMARLEASAAEEERSVWRAALALLEETRILNGVGSDANRDAPSTLRTPHSDTKH